MAKMVYTWNKETIQNLIDTNDQAVYNALIQIYRRQTLSEQASMTTHLHNSVGFTGADAGFLSSLAESYIKYKRLSPKQLAYARKKMKKYWRQLQDIAIQNGKNPQISK